MPHSSGGGSHGGGSHHSSSHSSHGGSGSSSRTSKTYFHGAKRYSYYNRHGVQEYVYSNRDLTKGPSKARYLILLFYIPFICAIVTLFVQAVAKPKPLKMDYNHQIVIEDHLGVLDEKALMNSLTPFQEKTGITPSVITVYDEEWKENYYSLEDYAFSLYVNHFQDEKHWLIVYSETMYKDESFNAWSYEGMQGDDTDPLITQSIADKFTDTLTENLYAENYNDVTQAIGKSFEEINEVIMEKNVDMGQLAMGFVMGAFICVHCYFMVFFDPDKKYRNAVYDPEEQVNNRLDALEQRLAQVHQPTVKRMMACKYCGSIFTEGECATCSNCGGELEYKDTSTEKREYYKEV